MSLFGRVVLPYSRSQFQGLFRKDTSLYFALRSPVRRQDVRGFRTKKEKVQQRPVAVTDSTKSPMLRYFVYAGIKQEKYLGGMEQDRMAQMAQKFERTRLTCISGKISCSVILMVPTTFCGAMIWQYENVRKLSRRFHGSFGSHWQKTGGVRDHLNALWNSYSDGERMVLGILSANVAIFLCWRIPVMQKMLSRYFLCMPGNPVTSTTLSAFSHYSMWHICLNMYVLWSFTPLALNIYGKEQFLAMYLSAATISSLTSSLAKNIYGIKVPSLGASGAILAVLASVCYNWPESRVAFAFVDKIIPHSFSSKSALIGLIVFDTLGILLRWKLFDHAAHLGGALFGLIYMRYGRDLTWEKLRRRVLRRWHNIRHRPADV